MANTVRNNPDQPTELESIDDSDALGEKHDPHILRFLGKADILDIHSFEESQLLQYLLGLFLALIN